MHQYAKNILYFFLIILSYFHFIEYDQAKLRQHYLSTPKHDELRGSITPIQKCNENQGEWMSQ